jgi:hypothetical protein
MKELIERLRDSSARHDKEADRLCNEAADAIEALQSKIEAAKQLAQLNGEIAASLKEERDALKAQIALGQLIETSQNLGLYDK